MSPPVFAAFFPRRCHARYAASPPVPSTNTSASTSMPARTSSSRALSYARAAVLFHENPKSMAATIDTAQRAMPETARRIATRTASFAVQPSPSVVEDSSEAGGFGRQCRLAVAQSMSALRPRTKPTAHSAPLFAKEEAANQSPDLTVRLTTL
eukprot:1949420-Rhodomonas_salina.2